VSSQEQTTATVIRSKQQIKWKGKDGNEFERSRWRENAAKAQDYIQDKRILV
jgi:hypothetical protein